MKVRLRTVIFATYVVTSAAGLLLLMLIILWEVRPHYVESMRRSMYDTARMLAVMMETRLAAVPEPERAQRVQSLFSEEFRELELRGGHFHVFLTDSAGVVLGDTLQGRKALGRSYDEGLGKYPVFSSREDETTRAAQVVNGELRIRVPVTVGGREYAKVGVGRPLSSAQEFILGARLRLVFVAGFIAGAMVLLGWWVASRVARSVEKLTQAVESQRKGLGPAAFPDSHAVEVSRLAEAFEQLRAELEGKAYVEKYTQHLTHEFKAPLSAMRGASELLLENPPEEDRRRFVENIRAECERLGRIVEKLLQLASLENRRRVEHLETVSLETLVAEQVNLARSGAQAEGRAISMEVEPRLCVRADRFLLGQALGNLLQNALDFTPPGGSVRVEVAGRDGRVRIAVMDTGCGVPDYALPRVFERFYSLPRPGGGRKSSGLGLSFVAEVVRLHGGSVTLRNREDGPGARAELELPNTQADFI